MALATRPALPRAEALAEWEDLGPEARDELLNLLEERFVVPRPIQVYVGGTEFTNESGVEALKECLGVPPASWHYEHLVLLTTLWLWEISKSSLTELNQADLSFAVLDDFYRAKWATYAGIAGTDEPAPAGLFELARELPRLRAAVERDHVRCMTINGATWERREWFMPRSRVRPDELPREFVEFLEERLGRPMPAGEGYRERFRSLADGLVQDGVNPAEAMVALGDYLVVDPVLRADYGIVTCVRGTKFDRLWTIQLADILAYTAIREGYSPEEHRVRLNHGQIRNAIAQRMRYNVITRMRNFSPVRAERMQAQSFQFPDFGEMEDAHHHGHQANGVRFVCRAPFLIDCVVDGKPASIKGGADLRVNRASYAEEDRFTPVELAHLIEMSMWMKAIVERSLELGVLLDEKYCLKQDFGKQGVVAGAGQRATA